jgi:hypothetical protein
LKGTGDSNPIPTSHCEPPVPSRFPPSASTILSAYKRLAPPSIAGVTEYPIGVDAYSSLIESPRRILPPCSTDGYTPTLTWLFCAAVRKIPPHKFARRSRFHRLRLRFAPAPAAIGLCWRSSRWPTAALRDPLINLGFQKPPFTTEPEAGNLPLPAKAIDSGVMAVQVIGDVPERHHSQFGAWA